MEWTKQLAAGTWRDARYALRGMQRRPGFAVLAIATLALGIGVNTTSLAVAHGILVRPLPYADPSRVVIINLLFPTAAISGFRRTRFATGCHGSERRKPRRATTAAKSPFAWRAEARSCRRPW